MKSWLGFKRWHVLRYGILVLGLAVVLLLPFGVRALSQGYYSKAALTSGSLVSLDPSGENAVQVANTDRVDGLLGVVVATNDSLVAASSNSSNVQVITTGTAQTLVSNLTGNIKKGDAITVSPINGVGMKATVSGRIIGLAESDFTATSSGTISESVKTSTGQRTVVVGTIPVQLAVSYYIPPAVSTAIPQSIENLARVLAGREVSPVRIVLSFILFMVGILLTVVITYGAIRISLESLGRNPLARTAINRGLLKILVISTAILLLTFGSVYLVIKG